MVAPPVGAWIETSIVYGGWAASRSRPPWARGLKPDRHRGRSDRHGSRPPWARGLKQLLHVHGLLPRPVAPPVGAWIETCILHGL